MIRSLSNLARNWKVALTTVLMSLVLLVGLVSQPYKDASAHPSRPAQLYCSSNMIVYVDLTVYDWSAPQDHHIFVKLPWSSPDMGGREKDGQTAWIYFYDSNRNWQRLWLTPWGTTNIFGVSGKWAKNTWGWWDSSRYAFKYAC